MKIFKEKQHSFFPRPLGIRDKLYLSVGIMSFFDLNDPDNLLTEQELWKTVPGELGPKPVIDQGIPKPRGEFLVTGSCHAPRGTSRPASQVRVRVGEVEKKLNVFGDRYWKNGLITEAEPFVEMPIVWPNAYGGEGFAENPLGKGIHKVPMPDGSESVMLPNLELPDQQIGSPSQAPHPAGFGPIDLMWPQRFKKNGTYDEKWKNERWPYFPDDMNYEFFNMACEDQFMDGYFKGGEPVTIENMNPDFARIESSLPKIRMRCFVTLNTRFKPHTFPVGALPSHQLSETDEFREVTTRLETVWFFPSIMRGLLIYRGTTEVMDEDGADVLRVMIRHEEQSDEARPIEYYRDLQIKLLDRGVDIDMSKAEEVMQKAQKSLLKVKNIPKFADDIRQKALGKRPSMPMPEPEEMLAKANKMIADHSALLDKLEGMARKIHAEQGHLIEINLGVFDVFRGRLASVGKKMEQVTGKLSATKKKLEATRKAMVKEMSGKIKEIKPEYLEKSEVDPETVLDPDFPFNKKVNPWHDRGFPFVVQCRKDLEEDRETMRKLTDLGFERKTVKRAWLGVNKGEQVDIPKKWGLKGEDEFTLPAGIVLPRFDGPVLNRINCHPAYPEVEKEFLVPGSDEEPLFLSSSTLIDLPSMPAAAGAPVVCVADELQALFMEQEVGDCCSVLALRLPGDKPGKEAAAALKNAQAMLIVQPEKYRDDRLLSKVWDEWKAAYKTAEPMELEHGKTVFESRKQGSDIRQWVFNHLPKEYAGEHSVDIGIPESGKPPGEDFLKGFTPAFPDVKALAKGINAEVKKSMEAKFAPFKLEQEKVLAQMREAAAKYTKYGVDPDKITMDVPSGPTESSAETGQKIAARIRKQVAELKKKKILTPEVEQKMEAGATKVESLGAEADARKIRMLEQFKAKKIELAEGLKKLKARVPPEQAKEKLLEHGLDPDAIRPLTREEVQRMHDQGKSIAGAILSGVDLSGLDLSGANLTGCQLKNTDFKETCLDNAKLIQTMGRSADFTKASLKGVNFERAMLGNAIFEESDLTGAQARQASFKGSSFKGATLADAVFDMAILEKTDFSKANLSGARINMSMVSGKADEADFRNAFIKKSIFKGSTLDGADFRKADVHETLFNGAKGVKVNFAGANLDKLRTGRNAEFPEADFTGATLRSSAFRETDLTGALFRGADLENALVDNCMLVDANLNGASAKGARFTKSNLEGASMRAFNLFMGGLRKARLVDTDLRGSNLYAVDFYKSVVGRTRFEGANLKRSQLQDKLDLLEDDS
ncbi:DUF2169 family type VI secretion system accessory protein [Maridesulfovibrio hydrothermalis]|uniref:Pentapeptide repeat protein n=1 Tax=Maridesulfovibrio hydrothermalis AM13 = DSM 14728 TaxID=1121451 RepID=L0RD82_9BACT|nr:pentapeptide repeat-containing protein [Maridesulfovibrio hydrothermalis]CCO24160.1 Pentapeptide repeat protein [Maridesulfovibrio hydrothermalis AM13 = DSM 14728]